MYDDADVRHGVTRKSQAKNVLRCKTGVGKVRIERRDWWLISPVTTMRVECSTMRSRTRGAPSFPLRLPRPDTLS